MRTIQFIFKIVFAPLLFLQLIFSGCDRESGSDAYGQFEATETTISAEVSGRVIHFTVNDGDFLDQNTHVGTIDTVMIHLKREELRHQIESVRARIAGIDSQIRVQQEELNVAMIELNRVKRLREDGAATEEQLDNAQGKVNIIRERINSLETEKTKVYPEIRSMEAKLSQMNEQVSDSKVVNPVNGTVLTSFVEPFEVVRPGQPLYRIANLDTLTLRVYISGAQLPDVKLGQAVTVIVDKNETENQQMEGTISWIASEAEFTPQMIQTKEERVTQVYAVKVNVPNPEGILKIGMPGEVRLRD
ncbi:MAG TPA: HlyD family efflux transporter periplasmic adaptor subunit [Balneolaceae bacterium]|nr:HlyD family efflux transporter periplasmic adaptor subunit [Balneolaceae bacterium]